MYILKIIMSTPLEAVRLVSKIFLGVDSKKSREYTFEKNSLKSFDYFELVLGCIF